MFKYMKHLNYPVEIHKKDLKMAKYLLTQYGGANGELGAAIRYFSQKFSMPDEYGESLLNDIATEELGHCEMICSMVRQLVKGASLEELKENGLEAFYTEHRKGVFPADSFGNPFTSAYFAVTGDVFADLSEDMAAEEKARATYENLIHLTNDEDLIGPLLFLRQREVVHFNRFKALYDYYKEQGL